MVYHILNGDALTDRFLATGLEGEMIVMRECLVEGDLAGESLNEFFESRAQYLFAAFDENREQYFNNFVKDIKKLLAASPDAAFNLWFGYDLFCQVNAWFLLSLLHEMPIRKNVYIVYPSYLTAQNAWDDFGWATVNDLANCYSNRVFCGHADLELGARLWQAYKNNDLTILERLSHSTSTCFPYLEEVCKAHIERFPVNGGRGRPEKVIASIVRDKGADFSTVFKEFYKSEGIYGFGDDQVKNIYDRVIRES